MIAPEWSSSAVVSSSAISSFGRQAMANPVIALTHARQKAGADEHPDEAGSGMPTGSTGQSLA